MRTARPDLGCALATVLAKTRPGELFSYSQIAAMAGRPSAARAVGRLLANSEGLPWWRVLTASGRLVPGLEAEQARLLQAEGLPAEPRPGGQAKLRSRLSRSMATTAWQGGRGRGRRVAGPAGLRTESELAVLPGSPDRLFRRFGR